MEKEDPSLLVHLNKNECKAFDFLQGGMKVIPVDDEFTARMASLGFPMEEGQIRDYRPLSTVIEDPAVQNIFSDILDKMNTEGEDSPELEHYYEVGKKTTGQFKDVPEHDPELKHLAEEGTDGDTEIVYMPLSVCDFMDEIRGAPKTNENTGFPEYGWNPFKSIARVVTTVGGFLVGGPVGALAGNALGRIATGQKPGSALMASLPNALYGAGAQGLGSLAGNFLPGAAGQMGQSIAGMGGNLSTGNLISGVTGGSAATQGTAASAPGVGGISSLLGSSGGIGGLLKNLAPLALGTYSVNQIKKGRKEEIAAWEKENDRARKEREAYRQRIGLYDELAPLKGDFYAPIDQSWHERESRRTFKKGGLTKRQKKGQDLHNYVDVSESYKGKGTGQKDNLKKKLPINGYIIPADVVGMVGDGNTNAGQDLLKKDEKKVLKKYKGLRINKKLATLTAKTSDGEHQFSPLYVTIRGGGDNDRGAAKLDHALKKIRHEKSQNGVNLQPKAKPFEEYLR